MKIITFDTETTGFPDPGQPLEKQPHICQFAAIMHQIQEGKLLELKRLNLLVKPPIPISAESSRIHGITDQTVQSMPSFAEVADQIIDLFQESDLVVAHNIEFDQTILDIELKRLEKPLNYFPPHIFDTMKETKQLCKLPGRNGNYKSPRLMELHQFLVGEPFEEAHNAIKDVEATVRCLEVLIDNGFFVPPEPIQKDTPQEQTSLF